MTIKIEVAATNFSGCRVTAEDFDPKRAEQVLEKNTTNRKLRDGVAEAYGLDMEAGRWTTCPDPICFYDDGALADGQHRMEAIVLSGTTQRFIVVYDLPREAGLNIDRGVPRNIVDNARISGLNEHLSNDLLSVTRAIELGGASANRRVTDSERLDMIAKHMEAAQWAISHTPKGRAWNNAIIKAALARAWYHETDHDRLGEFCDVIRTGQMNGKRDSAAVAIREYLTNMAMKGISPTSSGFWRDTFLKVQNAIHRFMRGEQLTVIRGVSDEAYPIAGKRKPPTTQRGKKALHRAEKGQTRASA